MYLAPLVAVLSWWWSRPRAVAGAVEDFAGGGASRLLREVVVEAGGLRLSVLAAFAAASLVPGAAIGLGGLLVFLAGVMLSAVVAATVVARAGEVADRAVAAFSGGGSVDLLRELWSDTSSIALAVSASMTGAVGALAWFFADPAGAVMIGAFSAGTTAGALFLVVSGVSRWTDEGSVRDGTTRVEVASLMLSAELVSLHIAAVAATVLVAALGPAESLLWLGGLSAETETLRSDLLLFPLALMAIGPILALVVAPLTASLLARRGARALFDAERGLSLLLALVAFSLVSVCGLGWAVAGAFSIGLAARQLLLILDAAVHHGSDLGRPRPGGIGLVAAVVVFAAADQVGGWYGVALAALGMTSTFVPAIASAIARGALAAAVPDDGPAEAGFGAADGTSGLVTTLAVLVAFATAATSASLREGLLPVPMMAVSVTFLSAVLAGAALSRTFAALMANVGFDGLHDASAGVRFAARATFAAVLVPAAVGWCFDSPAALGLLVGFMVGVDDRWPRDVRVGVFATQPAARSLHAPGGGTGLPEGDLPASASARDASCSRLAAEAMASRAWGRAMALSALAAAPLMV